MANYKTKYKIGDKLYVAGTNGAADFEVSAVRISKSGVSYAKRSSCGASLFFFPEIVVEESKLYTTREAADAESKLIADKQNKRNYENDKALLVELKKDIIEVEARLANS